MIQLFTNTQTDINPILNEINTLIESITDFEFVLDISRDYTPGKLDPEFTVSATKRILTTQRDLLTRLSNPHLAEPKIYTMNFIDPIFKLLSSAIKKAVKGDQTELRKRLAGLKKEMGILEEMVKRVNKRKKKKEPHFTVSSPNIASISFEELPPRSQVSEPNLDDRIKGNLKSPLTVHHQHRKNRLSMTSSSSPTSTSLVSPTSSIHRTTTSNRSARSKSINNMNIRRIPSNPNGTKSKSRLQSNSRLLINQPLKQNLVKLPDTVPDPSKWICPRSPSGASTVSPCGNYTPEFYNYCNFCGYPRDIKYLYNSTIERLDKRVMYTPNDDRFSLLIKTGNLSGIQWMIKKGWPINYRVQDSDGNCYEASELADIYGHIEVRDFFYSLEKTGPPRQKITLVYKNLTALFIIANSQEDWELFKKEVQKYYNLSDFMICQSDPIETNKMALEWFELKAEKTYIVYERSSRRKE